MAGGRSWLKWGCIGCGSVVLLFILAGVVIGLLGLWAAKGSSTTDDEVSIEVPRRPAPVAAPAAPPDEARSESPDRPADPPEGAGASGRVVLDLSGGEFQIRAAAPGEPLRVEATYDENGYELEQFVEEGPPWRATVSFGSSRSGLINSLAQIFGAESPRVKVFLPRDVRLELVVSMQNGALERFDLAGLDVESIDVEVQRGALILEVGEPLVRPVERMRIEVGMGAGVISNVGNASPAELDVSVRMGGSQVDLTGAWLRDARIELASSMSGMEVNLPHDLRVEGVEVPGMTLESEAEIPRPVLHIVTDGSDKKGGIQFRR